MLRQHRPAPAAGWALMALSLMSPAQRLLAQTPELKQTYTGQILYPDGRPVEGATVATSDNRFRTVTGPQGKFTLQAPATSGKSLIITFAGYQAEQVNLGNSRSITVTLKESASELDDVVVVGYGTRKRSEISGAVTVIGAEKLTNQPITSVDQGLAGLVPGVVLREGSGAPGAGPEILIRGINTFRSNKPLIVIDDVIYEDGNDQNNNPLALLNPEDVESITVLKDAASKAIYGSRATGGVILVKTKRGRSGKPRITFNSNIGQATVLAREVPDVLNAQELAQFSKEKEQDRIRATNTLYADPSRPVPDSLIPLQFRNPLQYGEGTNWFEAITRKATTQNHNISLSGGNQGLRFFVSGNYLRQEGIIINNDLTRYSVRANLDVRISDKLRFGLNLAPSRTEQNRPADDPGGGQFSAYGTITSAYWIDPSSPIYQPSGEWKYTTQGSLTSNWTANPLYQILNEIEKRRSTQLLTGTFLEFEPIKGLIFKSNLTYNYTQGRSQNFKPSRLVGDGSLNPVFPNIDSARALLFNNSGNNLISDNTVSYRVQLKQHSINLLGGYLVQQQTGESSSLSARRLVDENFILPDFNNVSQLTLGNFTGSEEWSRFRVVSLIGRANYNFANKYFANFSVRRDGSSRFGRDVQYGVFPAGSVAWRMSEEKFFNRLKSKWLDDLRLEVGYGLTGNQNGTSAFGFLGSVTQSNYQFGNGFTLGNTLTNPPNPLITWEESKQFDAGITFSLFKKRINASVNVYQQITGGLIADVPLSWVTGFGQVLGNQNSRVRNRGFEAQVDAVAVRNRSFTWNTSVNASFYRNVILDYYLPGGFLSGSAGNGTQVAISDVGQPIGMFRGLQMQGLFTAADIADPKVPKYPGAREGSQKYLDGNGDGRLGIEEDYVILGNPHPDLMFGWNNTLTFKGFSLRTIFAGQLGGLIYDLRREIMWNVDGNFNIDRQMLDRFRPGDDPTTKTFPTTVSLAGSTTRYVRFPGSNKVYDGSYVGLKNLTVGYNLTRSLNSKRRLVESAELYVTMRNVFYIASYKYGNPEVRRSNDGSALRSINYGSYPVSRNLSFGMNVSF